MIAKLEAFRAHLEAETRQRYTDEWKRDQARGFHYPLSVHEQDMVCTLKVSGRKYARVDVGTSGRYMVELATGAIYGIKAYGVIHRGHHYGTLDTVADYDWRGAQARKIETEQAA